MPGARPGPGLTCGWAIFAVFVPGARTRSRGVKPEGTGSVSGPSNPAGRDRSAVLTRRTRSRGILPADPQPLTSRVERFFGHPPFPQFPDRPYNSPLQAFGSHRKSFSRNSSPPASPSGDANRPARKASP